MLQFYDYRVFKNKVQEKILFMYDAFFLIFKQLQTHLIIEIIEKQKSRDIASFENCVLSMKSLFLEDFTCCHFVQTRRKEKQYVLSKNCFIAFLSSCLPFTHVSGKGCMFRHFIFFCMTSYSTILILKIIWNLSRRQSEIIFQNFQNISQYNAQCLFLKSKIKSLLELLFLLISLIKIISYFYAS